MSAMIRLRTIKASNAFYKKYEHQTKIQKEIKLCLEMEKTH